MIIVNLPKKGENTTLPLTLRFVRLLVPRISKVKRTFNAIFYKQYQGLDSRVTIKDQYLCVDEPLSKDQRNFALSNKKRQTGW